MNQTPGIPDPDSGETTPALDVEAALDVIPVIHRHHDGGIALTRKRVDGSMEQLWYITPDELQGMLRPIAQYLVENSYFSMNALCRHGPFKDKKTDLWVIGVDKWRQPGQRRFGRVTENLRYLNCCFMDIDCGRSEQDAKNELEKLSVREAQRRVEDLQDAGAIPPFSIMGHSGRGINVVWLLRDDRPGREAQSAPAFNWHIPLWKSLQNELEKRLVRAQLPVDSAGKLITQVYRIPGSIHGGTGKRVQYFVYMQGDQNKRLITYTLPELAAALDLQAIDGALPEETRLLAKPAQYRRVKKKGTAPARARGAQALNALRAQDLLTLSGARGGFMKRGGKHEDGSTSPGRRFILTLYANFLNGSGLDQEKALVAIREMAAAMRPPYPSDPDDLALDVLTAEAYSTTSRRRWKNEKLCKVLSISAGLARSLALQTILPEEVDREAEAALPLQADMIRARREWARKYLDLFPNTDCRELARAYKAQGITGANHQTANQDLNALGYLARNHKGGRPRRHV